jgi:hypothetical protein
MTIRVLEEIVNCSTRKFLYWYQYQCNPCQPGCFGSKIGFDLSDSQYDELKRTGTWTGLPLDPHAPPSVFNSNTVYLVAALIIIYMVLRD